MCENTKCLICNVGHMQAVGLQETQLMLFNVSFRDDRWQSGLSWWHCVLIVIVCPLVSIICLCCCITMWRKDEDSEHTDHHHHV